MDIKDTNPLGIVGLIGAIILVLGVFLTWLTLDLGIFGTTTWNGLDVFGGKDSLDVDYNFVPLVALICGIISLLLMLVPTFMNVDKYKDINNILGIVVLILSLVVVICGILFYTQKNLTDVFSIGIGFWFVLIGGIITLIGGAMPIVKNKLM